jgi:hypothetical protein
VCAVEVHDRQDGGTGQRTGSKLRKAGGRNEGKNSMHNPKHNR